MLAGNNFSKSDPILHYQVHVFFQYQQLWYFVTKIVLTYCEKKNVLVIEEKLLKFEAQGRKYAECKNH